MTSLPKRPILLLTSLIVIISGIGVLMPYQAEAISKYRRPSIFKHREESPSAEQNGADARPADVEHPGITYPYAVTPDIQAAFTDANLLYKSESWPTAQEKFNTFIRQFPYTTLTDAALYRLAQIADLQKQTDASQSYLSELIERTPDPEWRERARFLLGRSFFETSEYQRAYITLSQIQPAYLENWQKIHYYSLRIRLEEKRKQKSNLHPYFYLHLADAYVRHSGGVPGGELSWMITEKNVMAFLFAWSAKAQSLAEIPSEISQYAGGTAQAYALLHLAKSYEKSGDTGTAHHYYTQLVNRYPDHSTASLAKAALSKLTSPDMDTTYAEEESHLSVGVILPLSGPYGQFGHAILRGIRCGSGDEVRCGVHTNLSLVIRDTEGDPELAKRIFSSFEDDNSILMAFGPMSAKAVSALIPLLEDKDDFPLVSVAQGPIEKRLPNFFQARLTPQQQVSMLIEYAQSKGLNSIGLFYPNNSYGQEMATLFDTLWRGRGGHIPSKSAYRADGSDISDALHTLKLNVSYFTNTKANGFDAIFIPDAQGRIQKIMPYLVEENLVDIPLLGTNAWNGDPFPTDFETYFPGSVFPDIFYTGDSRPTTVAFIKAFKTAYGREPTTLEALGYDLAQLVNLAIQKDGKNRRSLKKALHNLHGVASASTLSGFSDHAEALFQVYLLTQKDGKWTKIK